MLLALTLIIVMTIGSLASNLYSLFVPFLQNVSDVTSYYAAYYGALSSVERGLLVTKYQGPGFEGSGGRANGSSWGAPSDAANQNLERLSLNTSEVSRDIESRTQIIPSNASNTISMLFAHQADTGFAVLARGESPTFYLSIDTTSDPEYYYQSDSAYSNYDGELIQGIIKLPSSIVEKFGGIPSAYLCDTVDSLDCDNDNDTIADDIMVLRSVQGLYDGEYFRIIPRTSEIRTSNPGQVDSQYDLHIRENVVNNESLTAYPLQRGAGFNPIASNPLATIASTHHVAIGSAAERVVSQNFQALFGNSLVSALSLSLSLVGLPVSRNQQLYPFLLYRLELDEPIADTNYHIQGLGVVNDYGIRMQIAKPVDSQQSIGSFTILF